MTCCSPTTTAIRSSASSQSQCQWHAAARHARRHRSVQQRRDAHPRARRRALRAERFVLERLREKIPLVRAARHDLDLRLRRRRRVDAPRRRRVDQTFRSRAAARRSDERAARRDPRARKKRRGRLRCELQWNDAQTNATLVAEAGATQNFTITETNGATRTQVWTFPSRNNCLVCHTEKGGGALTFNTRQMNRAFPDGATNQISALAQAGYLANAPPPAPASPRSSILRTPRTARAPGPLLPRCELRPVPPTRRQRARLVGCALHHAALAREDRQRRAP